VKIQRDVFGFVTINSFGKYVFGNSNTTVNGQKILYIQSPNDVPKNADILKTFKLLNGDPVFVAYTK
jgi:hypothetical protein